MTTQKNVVRILVKPGRISGSGAAKASEMFYAVASPDKAVIVQGARSYRAFRVRFRSVPA